jgi:chromosome segregation ATPase
MRENKGRVIALEETLASLQERVDELMSERELLDGQNVHDRTRVFELEKQMLLLQTKYNETFTNLAAANNTILVLQDELEAQRAAVAQLQATIEDLTRQYTVLEDKNKSQAEVIARRKKHSLDLVYTLAQSLTDIDLPFVRFNKANLI